VGKEKLQAFQDSFAKMFNISLCLMTLEGRTLTVWSNSSLFCHDMMKKNHKRCMQERQNAIKYSLQDRRPHIFSCYLGLTLFVCPVFCEENVVCVAYGGGVCLNNSRNYSKARINANIATFELKKLEEVVALLADTLSLINLPNEDRDDQSDREEPGAELSFLQNKLSRREIEVTQLIYMGLSNKQIANKLFISEKTVKTHVSNILTKLDLKDRMHVVIFCRENYANSTVSHHVD
jgi:DNA-binding CsgD family transcriptional regulator/ligand-binding sensor protein